MISLISVREKEDVTVRRSEIFVALQLRQLDWKQLSPGNVQLSEFNSQGSLCMNLSSTPQASIWHSAHPPLIPAAVGRFGSITQVFGRHINQFALILCHLKPTGEPHWPVQDYIDQYLIFICFYCHTLSMGSRKRDPSHSNVLIKTISGLTEKGSCQLAPTMEGLMMAMLSWSCSCCTTNSARALV